MLKILEDLSACSRSTKVALAATATSAAYLAYRHLSPSSPSSLSTLRGPPSTSLVSGNMFLVFDPDPEELQRWLDEYGNVFAMPALFGSKALFLADPKAVAHVTSKYLAFTKPHVLLVATRRLTGPGLAAMEGEDHKRQRRILQPSFSPTHVKQLTPGFVTKTQELKAIWSNECAGGAATINVLQGLDHLTLDIIGEAALGYNFASLYGSSNELAQAFDDLLGETATADPMHFLAAAIPPLAKLPVKRNIVTNQALAVLQNVGKQLVEAKRKELESLPDGGAEELSGKDLLSILLSSNKKEQASQKMSDEEVIAQIATFVIAGHDTTSSSTSWTLYALAKHPEVQRKLQEELLAFPHENPTLDDLNSMTYLDWVVKESMRRHPAGNAIQRMPANDEVIPLSEPVVDKNGKVLNEVVLKAGETIFISITALNWSTKYWGPDAREFRPERWANPPEESSVIPNVFANLMTFLAGPRACIGWRFALAETKAILFVLLRAFDFEIDPQTVIKTKSIIASRPIVVGEEKLGTRLPLIIKPRSSKAD